MRKKTLSKDSDKKRQALPSKPENINVMFSQIVLKGKPNSLATIA